MKDEQKLREEWYLKCSNDLWAVIQDKDKVASWWLKVIADNWVYATYPPSYPPQKRKCKNCGKVMEYITKQPEIKEWVEVAQ